MCKIICIKNDLGLFLNCLEDFGLSKDKNKLCCGSGTRPQNPEIMKMRGMEGSHISKSKSYKFKLKHNNTTELLRIYFHKFTITIPKQSQNIFKQLKIEPFPIFPDFL